ncbi:hypothetical protein ONZ51_g5123 [Trametes cubensis]|uniref:Uncharacterized protein n=1 Tax=Trametes cubensis TaxID=1111947 RepID=A0AAD7TWV7_9APHY|nr:hypothetical protein ONZ51_g5123 [Trametes cubensis]
MLHETQESFITGLREGLLTDDTELYHFHNRIRTIKCQVDGVRAEAYEATSWLQDVRNWYNGLSGKITHLCRNIDGIRAKLAKTQSSKRKLLEAQGYPAKLVISPYAQELLREYTQGPLSPPSSLFIPLACSGNDPTRSPLALSAINLPGIEPLMPASVARHEPEPTNNVRADNTGSPTQSSRTSTSSLFSSDSKHHLISEADLRDLLYLALSPLRSRQSTECGEVPSEKAPEASPQATPKPASNNGLYAQRQTKLAIRRAKRTGVKTDWLYRPIVRRSLAAIGMASAHPQPDPESLVPPGFRCGD